MKFIEYIENRLHFTNKLSLETKLMAGFLSYTGWLIVVCGLSWYSVHAVSERYELALKTGNSQTQISSPSSTGAEAEIKAARAAATFSRQALVAIVAMTSVFSLVLAYFLAKLLTMQLIRIADQLRTAAGTVSESSNVFSKGATDLSSSASTQASALQETMTALDEVNATLSTSAENARKSQEVAKTSQQNVLRGKQAVEDMIQAINVIHSSNNDVMTHVETNNQEISKIVKVISEIENKTKIINDIVFQTKLLSFNASVEAARAGEHGKGFAVVAEEVGNLAQMSGNASREISEMLTAGVQSVENIVNQTRSSVEKLMATGKDTVDQGIVKANFCGEMLGEIVKNVTYLNQMVEQISTATQEQSQGTGEIAKAMNQLDGETQKNAASSNEAANTAEQLSSQAHQLHDMVEKLLKIVHGQT